MRNKFSNGMKVRIKGITRTHRRFKSDRTMREMVGGIYRIERCFDDHVKIKGYTWCMTDIEMLEPSIKYPKSNGKEIYFDETLIAGV